MEELYKEPNIVKVIRSSRLRWAEHVVRMDENGLPKKLVWTNPGSNRERGRPKSRWIDGVQEDTINCCRNWRADAHDRGRRRHLLEEARTLPGL